MKKIIILSLIFLCFTNGTFSQTDTLFVKIQNQYEAEIPAAKITVIRTGKTFITDDRGGVTIEANKNDSVTIESEVYNAKPIAINEVDKKHIIVVHKNFTWKDLITPMFYIINGGLWVLLLIVFAETGLFIGFFLPGDSLLFVAGIFSNKVAAYLYDSGSSAVNLLLIITLVSIAGILGNTVGYWFGKKVGYKMYSWNDNILFKKHYLEQAHAFYEKHGGSAIIFARFIPIVRTFAPIVAGIVEMDKKKFHFFNWIGCIAWSTSMLAAGHYLYRFFLEKYHFDLTKHLEVIVLGIVLVTTAPVIIKLVFGKKKNPS